MRSNRRRDTGPEIAVRRALHRIGLRYRVDFPVKNSGRSVRPDIVFTKQRIAVFIDGCFWHGCPLHATFPRTNAEYWLPKLHANKERDAATTRRLEDDGWTVLRFWEHEDADDIATRIAASVRAG